MARVELLPLSIAELNDQPLNMIDYLLAANFQSRSTPFNSREELAKWILRGGYPEPQSKRSRAKQIWYKSYIEGRLFKDFETLYTARGDYHSKLQALAPYLAGLSGNLLKYANIGNDLDLDDRLVKNYIEILDLMFIVHRLPAYLKNRAKRQATRMPKIHYVDTGLACHLLGLRNESQLLNSQYYGGLLENLIFTELYKHASWAEESVDFFHFRDKKQNEVDIVLERSNTNIIGIEIKASAIIKQHDFRGLEKLAEFAGPRFERGILFYSGEKILPFKADNLTFYALPIGLMTSAPIANTSGNSSNLSSTLHSEGFKST